MASDLPDEAVVRRMMALVREMNCGIMEYFHRDHYREAAAIAALLPEPVDPDLIEARHLAWDHADFLGRRRKDEVLEGACDDGTAVRAMLAALKRGRELAGERA